MKHLILRTMLVLLIAAAPQFSHASQPASENVELLGEWAEGRTRAIAVGGDVVYLGTGPRFQIIDYCDPQDPRYLANIALSETVTRVSGIDVRNGLAYMVTPGNVGKVFVLDVTNPARPEIVLEQVVRYGNYIQASDGFIVVSGMCGAVIMEWNGDDALTEVWRYPESGSPYPIVLGAPAHAVFDGDYLYYGYGGIDVFDITDPAAPQLVGSNGDYGGPTRVALDGNRVYVTDYWMLRIYDVSDPSNPLKIDSLSVPLGNYYNDVVAAGQYAYVATSGGLAVVEVSGSQPANVVWSRDAGSTALAIDASRLFVGCNSWVQSFDVTDPAAPVEGPALPAAYSYVDVTVKESRAYVADESYGLRIVDVSDPASPVHLGHYFCGTDMQVWNPISYIKQIEVLNGHAYVFDMCGLTVVDVGDPYNPVEVARLAPTTPTPKTAAGDNHIFVTNQHEGFTVLDVTNPAAPVEAAVFGTDLGVEPLLALDDDFLYVVEDRFIPENKRRLRVVDVSVPVNPLETGSAGLFDLVAFAKGEKYLPLDIAVSNGFVYLPCSDGGVRIFDATDPGNPWEVGRFKNGLYFNDVAISGNVLYVTAAQKLPGGSYLRSIRVLNISDPSQPTEIGWYYDEKKRTFKDIFADKKRLYGFCGNLYQEDTYLSILKFQAGGDKKDPGIAPLSKTAGSSLKPVLERTYPNPFNPITTIEYDLPTSGRVRIEIYDARGGFVTTLLDRNEGPGRHAVQWNGRDARGTSVSSGVYFVRLESSGDVQARKIVLLK